MSQRILLIDSDRAVREALGCLLVAEGYEVVLCEDLDSAAHCAANDSPDVAIMDFSFPMSAEAARYRIRSLCRTNLPILAITVLSGQSKAIISAGACEVLEKPLSLPVLLQILRRLTSSPAAASHSGRTPEVPDTPQFKLAGRGAGAPSGGKITEIPDFSQCLPKF